MIKDDVIVVGGGIIGMLTARYLEDDYRSVTLIDKAEPGLPGGISKGSKAINVRGDLPHWKAHIRSKEAWESIFSELGIYSRCVDQVTLGAKDAAFMHDLEDKYSERAINHFRADGSYTKRKYGISLEDKNYAIVEPDSVLLVDGSEVLSRLAEDIKHRVNIMYHSELAEITESENGLIRGKLCDEMELECDSMVICAGPWAQRVLAPLGIDPQITITSQQTSLLEFSREDQDGVDRLPYLIDRRNSTWNTHGAGMFLVPGIGLIPTKVGRRGCGPTVDKPYSDDLDTSLDQQVHEYCRSAFDLAPLSSKMEPCYYPTNPTDRIIIGKHDSKSIYYAAGCYGAAFKLAPVVGKAITSLMASGRVSSDMMALLRT